MLPWSSALRAFALATVLSVPMTTPGGVVVNELATWPADPILQTFPRTDANVEAERDVRFTRNLAQTFQTFNPLQIDKIYVDYEEGLASKEITIRIFSVADVNAGSLIQPEDASFTGTTYFSLVHTTTALIDMADAGNNPSGVLEFDLTGEDEVTLPANTGNAGYAFQLVRSGTGSEVDDGAERAFKWHFNDGNNLYPNGRSYAIFGGGVDASDDFLFAIEEHDQSPPTLAAARSSASLNTLTVVFSEGVDSTSATTLGNYSVSPSLTLSNPEMLDSRSVRFTTTAQTEGAEYTVTVSNVKDDSPQANTIAAGSEITFRSWIRTSGFLTAEFFHNVLPFGSRSVWVDDLTTWPAFVENRPDEIIFLPQFDTPSGYGDDYGARVTGVLVPQVSGDYHFFIRSDDSSKLYINPNGPEIPEASFVYVVAEETDCCDAFQEPGTLNDDGFTYPTTILPITLTAGERYGVMFLLKEGGGGDYGQVAWRREGDPTPAAELLPMSGELFETFVDPTGASLEITTHPADFTAQEALSASFSVAVNSSTPYVGYQWLMDGVEIPGGVGPTLTISPVLLEDDGAEISVRVRVPGIELTSSEAILTVLPDEVPPTIASASARGDRSTLTVRFSEAISESTLTALANYSVSPSLTLSDPVVLDPFTVQFTTSQQTVGTEHTLTVNNVVDLAGNAIAADSSITFFSAGLLLENDAGFVIFEAEHYDRLLGTLWEENTTSGTPSGGVSMHMPDNVSDNVNTDILEYDILFTKTGTHKIWYRARADDGGADSVFLRVDGAEPAGRTGDSASMSGFNVGVGNDFVWRSDSQTGPDPMTFEITTLGMHTIGIASREDGAYIDKIIITTDMAFTPEGFGPGETPREGEPPPPPADITITLQPESVTGDELQFVTLSIEATSDDPLLSFQWQRQEGGTFVDIEGATGTTLRIDPLTLDWDGAVLRVAVSVPGNTVFSQEVTVTVTPDTVAPEIVQARGFAAQQEVTLLFSEDLDPTTAQNASNYSISGPAGALGVISALLQGDRTVVLLTDAQTVGAKYTVTVNGVRDLAATPNATAGAQAKFFSAGAVRQQGADGLVVFEAEDYDGNPDAAWIENSTTGTPSGGVSMVVPNGTGTEEVSQLQYFIDFTQTGTHIIWYRAYGPSGTDDSAWLFLDGARPPERTASNDAAMSGFDEGPFGDFVWESDSFTGSDPMTFEITTTGIHTIAVARREDGSYFDKFAITTDPTFNPNNYGPFGPPETREGIPPAPSISISSPAADATFEANADVPITVDITATGREVALVEFFEGANKIGESTASPFGFTWMDVPTGIYALTARLTDDVGDVAVSSAVQITVGNPLDPLSYEGFDYAAGVDLSGQNGGFGWITEWGGNSGGVTVPGNTPGDTAQEGSLTYVDANGNQLVTTGNSALYSGETGTSQPFRDFALTGEGRGLDGTTTWISLLIQRDGATVDAANPYPRGANIAFFDGGSERFGIGNPSGSPDNFIAITHGGSTGDRRPSSTPFNELSFAVLRIDHLAGNDNAYLFINPPLDQEPDISTADAQDIGGFDFTFNRVRPFSGNTDTGNNRPFALLYMDELRIGETYAQVTPYTQGGDDIVLSISKADGQVTIQWDRGTLQSAPSVLGPWDDVEGAAPPSYTFTPGLEHEFFQVIE